MAHRRFYFSKQILAVRVICRLGERKCYVGICDREVSVAKQTVRACALEDKSWVEGPGGEKICEMFAEGRLSNGHRSIQLRYPVEVIATRIIRV